MAKTVRVAILGGGMAGVAAAWTLAHATGDVQYEITVYDANFRLGGKCASSHDVPLGSRVEEHGIHILLGFYSQVLRILRDCYAEIPASLGFKPFDQALEPGDQLQLPDKINGTWTFWTIDFPPNTEKPGDTDPSHRDFAGALLRAAEAVALWVEAFEAAAPGTAGYAARLKIAAPSPGKSLAETALGLAGFVAVLEELLARPPTEAGLAVTARHLWMGIWFGATNLIGIVKQRLFTAQDFQSASLNAQDYKAWLQSVGGSFPSPELTWNSPIVNAVYDLVFSRAVGFAAGAALYDVLLMLLMYDGHVFYRMAGTGDVIFGPLYFALRARGVHFRFEHTVTDVKLGPPGPDGRPRVVEIDVTGDGTERTVEEIFVKVGPQWCWPATSLVNRPVRPFTLGPDDFDYVVSAIPLGALPSSAPSLMGLPVIAAASKGIVTIPTQSIQLWFDQPLAQLGWTSGRMMLGSFDRPFNSCADMAQVLPYESLPGERAVLYMSDVYEGQTADQAAADAQVRTQAIGWVQASLPTLLPGFSWPHLLDPENGLGSNRFDAQYWRANITGTEQYVASAPGTVALRPSADGAGVENLLLASDWVITEENQGCVEGAARSGVTAAMAIDARAQTVASSPSRPGGATTGQPVYVQNDGDWVFPGPVQLSSATAHAFPFLASESALAALCARYSVGGATVRPWLPSLPLVLVYGCASADIGSLDPRFQAWGKLAEREVGVFVPVVVEKAGTSFVALLCPYLFVDNGATLSAGREIYGLPKELATFPDWPYAGPVPLPLTATGLVLPEEGDRATMAPILTVSQIAALPLPGVANLAEHLETLWDDLTGAGTSVSLVALKQFHAIESGAAACYQALVRCQIEPDVKSAVVEVGFWQLSLPAYFFPTPSTTLGLANGEKTLVSVKASLDFTLSLGTVV